jgi:hypothetical protein
MLMLVHNYNAGYTNVDVAPSHGGKLKYLAQSESGQCQLQSNSSYRQMCIVCKSSLRVEWGSLLYLWINNLRLLICGGANSGRMREVFEIIL